MQIYGAAMAPTLNEGDITCYDSEGNLKNLREGDIAIFTDMDGNVFTYKMIEQETLLPTSIDAMESGDWDLTLFTCTVGGQSRVTIRFELITETNCSV